MIDKFLKMHGMIIETDSSLFFFKHWKNLREVKPFMEVITAHCTKNEVFY